jgi:hypothetical protein
VAVLVSQGLYSVMLGDTTLSNMSAWPPTVFTNSDVRLRVWFDDGTNGFEQLHPDQRIAAVGYAIMAGEVSDGSITLAKLADEVKGRLGGPSAGGTVVLSHDPASASLTNAGFIRLGGAKVTRAEWEQNFLETSFNFGVVADELTNFWSGTEVWFWRWGAAGIPGQGVRYNPALNQWTLLNTNNAPALDRMNAAAAWIGSELLVVGTSPEGLKGARYHPTLNTWTSISTNGAPRVDTEVKYLWNGIELLVLGRSPEGIQGGRYQPGADQWQLISTNGTNGLPPISLMDAKIAGLATGLLLLGSTPAGIQGIRYHSSSNAWTPISTNNLDLMWSPDITALWAGENWLLLANRPDGLAGFRYRPVLDAWTAISTNGAPRAQMNSRFIWADSELVVLTFGNPPMPEVIMSARYNPATDQWRPISRFGPSFNSPPWPEVFFTGSEILVVQKGDPSKWAKYTLATDRWTLLNGPTLGWDVVSIWTGAELLSFITAASPGMEALVHRYTPALPLYQYLKP